MQTWQTPLITLKADSSDIVDGTVDLECKSVTLEPAAGAGPKDASRGGSLIAGDVDTVPLTKIDWTPKFLSFSSVGNVQPQTFEISNYSVESNGTSVRFTIAA